MKIRPVRAKLFHADRLTEGRTYMTKVIVRFSHFANAPKIVMPDYTVLQLNYSETLRELRCSQRY